MLRYFFAAFLLLAGQTPAAELVQKDILVYGQNIHYAEAGSGQPIVLLHGLWGGLNEWQPIIDTLAESHRVIAMDLPGFHGSDKPDVQYHNALLSEFVAGFVHALKLHDAILMGHAMGANTATYTAFHHPEAVAALILIDGAGYRNPDRDLTKPLSAGQLRFRRIATGSTLAATRSLLERRVVNKSLITDAWVEQAFALWIDSAKAIGDMLFEGGDLTEAEMRQIQIPTLVLWGANDQVFEPSNADRLANDIDRATVTIIENSGHLPQIEQTEVFLTAVSSFLSTLGTQQ